MRPNLRTLVGSILLVLLTLFYAWLTVAVASARLAESSGLTHLIFFATTGLFWILPAMWLVRWMYRPRENNGSRDD
ncbi:DUF2842 domain-containing protein [Notoacmeibacter marinus]|uniref:DUF2842 domain-containing protein n=1 Tax=Notoacmeibacter marinus TaxID=1876515 RepID=UPI000DF14FB4|nr:DUF2842 domain-containing protein [Notoacmeibacter marinus]